MVSGGMCGYLWFDLVLVQEKGRLTSRGQGRRWSPYGVTEATIVGPERPRTRGSALDPYFARLAAGSGVSCVCAATRDACRRIGGAVGKRAVKGPVVRCAGDGPEEGPGDLDPGLGLVFLGDVAQALGGGHLLWLVSV
ncbi:hypothetical protein LIA77_08108 [Sarocladium implicatum]|nr:hypothetical protein LIA77_08108 [Sarocladium implicatum]